MAGRKRKRQQRLEPAALPTVEQLRNGDFKRDFVTHAETSTKAMTFRRRDGDILEKWLGEGAPLFPIEAQRFIGDCITLWGKVGAPRITAHYGERISTGAYGDSITQLDALDQLHRFKSLLGPYQRHYWTVFENVVRHNEPAGVAGSHFANNPAQRIQSAKLIVSTVATDLAAKLGY